MNNKEQEERLVDAWTTKFKRSMVQKSKETMEWERAWSAYTGESYMSGGKPKYKSDQVSNFIFSTIETIRPIMVDGEPGFVAMARTEDGLEAQAKIQTALDYEFAREKVTKKIQRQTTTSLVLGTSVWYVGWNGDSKHHADGDVEIVEVNPFNFFPDPMATSLDDSEYVIYAKYENVNKLKKRFPDKANSIDGGSIQFKELIGNIEAPTNVQNQVLVLEVWCRDYSKVEEEYEEEGKTIKESKLKYPNGRVITLAPDLNIVLEDKENPYDDGKFPFVMIKNYDVPFKFWGDSEVTQLLSPQEYINDLSNQIIDNARLTANMPWIMDKNSGIGYGTLTNQPGLIIRKNPGTEVRRDQPPTMPNYVMDKIHDLKTDMESISGVHDVTKGKRPTGIQAGNAIVALQEAGQARIRMKVKLMEEGLSEIANMVFSRMKQFWKLDRWIRVQGKEGDYEFTKVTSDDLENEFDIEITAGSTMQKNRAGMLDLLIRLGQTTAEDGLPVVDRDTILSYVDVKNKDRIVERFKSMQEQQNINQEVSESVNMMGQQLEGTTGEISDILNEVMEVISQMDNDIAQIKEEKMVEEQEKQEEEKQTSMEEQAVSVAQEAVAELLANLSDVAMEEGQQPEEGLSDEMGAEDVDIDEEELLMYAQAYIDGEVEYEELEAILEQLGIPMEEFEIILEALSSESDIAGIDAFDDETLLAIDSLSEEELMQLLELHPELMEILGNNPE